MAVFYLIIFIFGLVVGSFLNCVIYRLEEGKSFLTGRSFCPHCKHTLSWQDLIPVFSFLFLRGKCRYCQKKISWQYPIVELTAALIFVLIFSFSRLWRDPVVEGQFISTLPQLISTLYLWVISCFLIIIFVYDLKHYIIPDKVIYSAIIVALIFNLQFLIFNQFFPTYGRTIFNSSILSAIGAGIFFLIIVLATKGKGMGVGDIKLAFFMGIFLGFPNILAALFLAFFIGAIIGVGLVILKQKNLKSEVPFGPFLITGTFMALFYGKELINWYIHLFSPF